MRRPSLVSIPESVDLSTAQSDNCDWKVNNYKQTNIRFGQKLLLRDSSLVFKSNFNLKILCDIYLPRTNSPFLSCTRNKLDCDYLDIRETL